MMAKRKEFSDSPVWRKASSPVRTVQYKTVGSSPILYCIIVSTLFY